MRRKAKKKIRKARKETKKEDKKQKNGNVRRERAPDCPRPPDVFCVYEKLRKAAPRERGMEKVKNDQTVDYHAESS